MASLPDHPPPPPDHAIAVVLPVYNGEQYLAETLQSLLDQTLPPAEILVLDDGSRDRSAAIALSFGPRVRVLSRPNAGISATRNAGAALVSAPWIAFLDQDDLLEPTALERRARALADHPTADVCYTDRRHLTQHHDGFALGEPIRTPTVAHLLSTLRTRCPFNPGCATIRRSTFLSLGGFDPRFDGVEDWNLWLRLLSSGSTFLHLGEALLQYRVHGDSATQNAPRILDRSLALLRENVYPDLSPLERLTDGRRSASRLLGEASIVMRAQRCPGATRTMLRSLLLDPLHQPRRYKILAHMLTHPPLLARRAVPSPRVLPS